MLKFTVPTDCFDVFLRVLELGVNYERHECSILFVRTCIGCWLCLHKHAKAPLFLFLLTYYAAFTGDTDKTFVNVVE
jgi:hypothetical protein